MTQRQIVEAMLRQYGQASAHDLTYRHGITRSASIIHRLRRAGWDITTTVEADNQAVYHLVHTPQDTPPAAAVQTALWDE
jgi:hypothetical protein